MGRSFVVPTPGRELRWAALVLVGLSGSCVPAGRPLPIPVPRTGDNLPSPESVLDIGRRQSYDPNPGASDRAVVEDDIEVTIEPQEGTYRQSEERLALGSVVAELQNHSQKPLRKYALAPGGRSYWVVYKKKDQWLSAFIAESPNRDLDRFDVPTVIHPPTRAWRQSIAQWQLRGILERSRPGGADLMAEEVLPWTTCLAKGCCKVGD